MPARDALVTGGAQGIGRAVAEKLAAAGWNVTVADCDQQALDRVAGDWSSGGMAIAAVPLDVTDRDAVGALMSRFDRLDVLVNNAGIAGKLLALPQLDRTDFGKVLRVNVGGAFIVTQEAVRRMQGGAIINIASRGYLGGAGGSHYVASKAAVVAMTRALAVELRWRGIAVNAVAPGMVDTRMIAAFTDTMRARLNALDPNGGAIPTAVIAEAVAYLASDSGRLLNGQVLLVDGGKSLGIEPF